MEEFVPVHEKLRRFFGDIHFDFPNPKDQKCTSVRWLHSKYLLHEGYVRKKRPHSKKRWQERYIMLFGHYVFYFKNTESKRPRGWFSLRAYDKVSEDFGDNPEKRRFNIKIKNSRNNDIRVFWFRTKTYPDLQMWKACFQATIDYIHKPGHIQNRYQEHILERKGLLTDSSPEVPRSPDYSIMLDSRISGPELSLLARSLGREWRSFALEKLCIPQKELDIMREGNNCREEEVYAVLLHWRKKERDNATKGKLIELLKDFSANIDDCGWQFLENRPAHDYTNDRHKHDQDSNGDVMRDQDVYDDVTLSSHSSSDDLFSKSSIQSEDSESESEAEYDSPPEVSDSLPPTEARPRYYNRNDGSFQDQTPTWTHPPTPLRPLGRQRNHSSPNHTTDQTPTWTQPPTPPPLHERQRNHSSLDRTTEQAPRWAPQPSPPPPPTLGRQRNHSSLDRTTDQTPRWAPPPTPLRPLGRQRNHSSPDHTSIQTQGPALPPRLFPPEVSRVETPHNSQQGQARGLPPSPRRTLPAAGAERRNNPLFQRPGLNQTFAEELSSRLARR